MNKAGIAASILSVLAAATGHHMSIGGIWLLIIIMVLIAKGVRSLSAPDSIDRSRWSVTEYR